MSLTAPMRCSTLAEELGEPMIGTLDRRRRWLLLEDDGAWGSHAVRDVLGVHFEAAAKKRGLRVLLVRQRPGPADASRRAFVIDTELAEAVRFGVGDVAALDLAAIDGAPLVELGEPWTEPVFLVCTNGRRDACCALRGRALYAALSSGHGERTWECTHLGGHRFAANMVCLPHGIAYGRATAADGPRLADLYLDGQLDPGLLRGRSAWPEPAQVAEAILRQQLGLTGVDDVRLLAVDQGTVVLAAPSGDEHRFELHAERLPARRVSCRADEPEEPLHWSVVGEY